MTAIKQMKQWLEALENAQHFIDEYAAAKYIHIHNDAITSIRQAIEQAEKQSDSVEPVAFLANGTRFKMAFFDRGDVTCFGNFEKELDGRWVALVSAEDDCHLKCTHPQPKAEQEPKREPLTDEQKYELIKQHLGLDKRRDDTVIDRMTGRFTDAARYFDLIDAARNTNE